MTSIQIKVGVLVERNGKLLLIREWSNKRGGYFWNIIKGTLDNPEEGIIQCALRECVEEACAKVSVKKLVDVFYSKGKRVQLDFLADFVEETGSPNKQDQLDRGEDITEKRWMDKNDLGMLREDEFINSRSYLTAQAWLKGVSFPLDILKEIED